MSPFEVYCILMLDNINGFFSVVFVVVSVLLIVFISRWAYEHSEIKKYSDIEKEAVKIKENNEWFSWFIKRLAIGWLVICLISTLFPTTKQAFVIYALPKIANNENVQKLPDLAMQALNAELKKIANDTKNT